MERIKMNPEELKEKAEQAKGVVQDTIKNVSAQVQGRYEALKDTISEYREKDFSEIFDDVKGFTKEHPVPMILGALFLGYGIGRIFTRKND
jgi:hypothetical protein